MMTGPGETRGHGRRRSARAVLPAGRAPPGTSRLFGGGATEFIERNDSSIPVSTWRDANTSPLRWPGGLLPRRGVVRSSRCVPPVHAMHLEHKAAEVDIVDGGGPPGRAGAKPTAAAAPRDG